MFTLKNEYIALSVDDKACLTEYSHIGLQTGNLITRPIPMFRVVLHHEDNWEDIAYAENAEITVEGEGEHGCIKVSALNTDMGRFPVEMQLKIRLEKDKMYFDSEINNKSEALVNELVWPCFGAMKTIGKEKTGLLFPHGLGVYHGDIINKLSGVSQDGGNKTMNITYPKAKMQWLMLQNEKRCFYVSGRDDQFMVGNMTVVGSPECDISVEMSKWAFVAPGEVWQSPSFLIWYYEGTWQQGAEEYRSWADSWYHPVPVRSWMHTMTGFCLVINKQQYGDEVWSYHDIPKLYDIAQAHGCDTLGLFGWFETGHDNFYPDLTVSESMGGEKALREGIQKVHEKGGRVVLYYQGHLIDVNTPYFKSGKGWRDARKNYVGQPYYEHYCKYSQSEFNRYYGGRTFATACPWCKEWQDLMAEKAEWIYSLGADGVLFDQLGGMTPAPCFDKNHGHPKASIAFGLGRHKLLRRIREAVDKHDDYCVMIEGLFDPVSQFIDCTHGGIKYVRSDRLNASQSKGPFTCPMPEMFRHTFPEAKTTHRIAKPYMDFRYVNSALCYGAVYEFEIRYLMDRQYVEEGRHPEWFEYAAAMTRMRQKHPELLLNGRYSCNPELAEANPFLKHGFFTAGDQKCVVFWNDTDIDLPLNLCSYTGRSWENPYESGEEIPSVLPSDAIIVIYL